MNDTGEKNRGSCVSLGETERSRRSRETWGKERREVGVPGRVQRS